MSVPLAEVSGIFFYPSCNYILNLTYNQIKNMDIFVELIGIVLIFAATDVGRKKESEVTIFSFEHLFQMLLVGLGLVLVVSSELAQHALK